MKHSKARLFATAVVTLLGASACGSSDSDDDNDTEGQTAGLVRCQGINECAGMSECESGSNSCEGMNECKGMGFLTVPADDCEEQGGINLDAKKKA